VAVAAPSYVAENRAICRKRRCCRPQAAGEPARAGTGPGDRIEVGGMEGDVVSFNARSAVLRALGAALIVP